MAWSAVEMYTNGLEFFDAVVAGVDAEGWTRPSPCEGWSALDVLGHVGEATMMGVRVLGGGDMSFTRHDPPSSVVDGDPAGWWAGVAADARDSVSRLTDADLDREVDSPMGRRSVGEGLSFPAVDLFVHGWDIATATGQEVTFPDAAIAFTRAMFDKVPDEASRRPGVFADVQAAGATATPTEQLIAWTGRDPGWSAA